ncbi:FlgK family flagellar hook-associated protein [Roseinatronobacter sp.]|uniref:FlgK family flagellar hook-associated protein n=1 Tax=Roseinatronobacter sp. TaxID=1945755 RepID=UPI0025D3932D|nr:flagellar basal body rod C-terminal domain-containing protein [Roseibaca sp.]
MSLGIATNTAMGGIRMTALGTRLVAENLANAEVDGYGVRSLVPSSLLVNNRNMPIQREVNPVVLGAARRAESAHLHTEIRHAGMVDLERTFGLPGESGSLNSLVTQLDSSLRQAASMPDSDAALHSVAQDAGRLVAKFNATESAIQSLRQQADDAVAVDINMLNSSLDRVAALNVEIQRQTLLGGNTHGLMDERQRVTSEIARIIPITEIPRDNDRIMLLAANGQILADLTHAEFGFTPSIGLVAGASLSNGAASPVSLDGRPLAADSPVLGSGRVGANLAIRDEIAPRAQTRLDTLAYDLLKRFSGPDADASLAPNALGMFTLDGVTTLPAMADGLAGRMQLSARINPDTGEGLWRLRSGLNAAAPGPSLDPANLNTLSAVLEKATSLQSGTPARAYSDHVASQVSALATARLGEESSLTFTMAQHAALQEELAAQGVDTDRQMQNLLTLERAYAANARVLSAIDQMMRNLLEI